MSQSCEVREWVRALSDDVLVAFGVQSEPCYRELFRRYGAKTYQFAMKLGEDRPDSALESFTFVWSRIRTSGSESGYRLGEYVLAFINRTIWSTYIELLNDPMSKKGAA